MIYIQSQQCEGCGACMDVCPVGAIHLINQIATIDYDKCQNCEVCVTACSNNAIVAILEQEPVSDIPSLIPVPSQPAVVQYASPKASIMPWVGTALAFVGREILPRVAVSLLEAWDHRTRQPTSLSGMVPSASPNSNATPVTVGDHRGRKHRQRRRGQC